MELGPEDCLCFHQMYNIGFQQCQLTKCFISGIFFCEYQIALCVRVRR